MKAEESGDVRRGGSPFDDVHAIRATIFPRIAVEDIGRLEGMMEARWDLGPNIEGSVVIDKRNVGIVATSSFRERRIKRIRRELDQMSGGVPRWREWLELGILGHLAVGMTMWRVEIERSSHIRADIRREAKIRWGAARTKNLTHRNDEVPTKNVGKDHSQIRMVQDAPKGGVNVINMNKDIVLRVSEAVGPECLKAAKKSVAVVNCGASIGVGTRFWNVGIRRTSWIGTIGAVHAYPAFTFPSNPLKWVNKKAVQEIEEKAGKR